MTTTSAESSTKLPQKRNVKEQVYKVRHHLSTNPNDWDTLWKNNTTPWDLGHATPLLINEINKRRKLFQNFENVLVPGCGSGYDLISLSNACNNANITGLDTSPTSIQRAKDIINNHNNNNNIQLACDDYFTFQHQKFDFIYDYTFFCALHPSKRAHWGNRIKQLLKKDGMLFTILFPILSNVDEENKMKGPPYPVKLDDYKNVLLNDNCSDGRLEIYDGPYASSETVLERKGMELVVWWKKI